MPNALSQINLIDIYNVAMTTAAEDKSGDFFIDIFRYRVSISLLTGSLYKISS